MDLLNRLAIAVPDARPPGHSQPLDIAALIGPAAWNRLPAAVRHRFARGHADATYEGALDLDCSRLGRCFALAARLLGGPLTGHREQAVPASVRAYADGHGGMVWERHLAISGRAGRARCVRSTKLPGDAAGTLIERTDGGLSMELDVFEDEGALVFRSRRYFFAWYGWQLPVPLAFTPGVCRVEHRDQGGGRFRFTMGMDHPWWGQTFHQTGLFADPVENQA